MIFPWMKNTTLTIFCFLFSSTKWSFFNDTMICNIFPNMCLILVNLSSCLIKIDKRYSHLFFHFLSSCFTWNFIYISWIRYNFSQICRTSFDMHALIEKSKFSSQISLFTQNSPHHPLNNNQNPLSMKKVFCWCSLITCIMHEIWYLGC